MDISDLYENIVLRKTLKTSSPCESWQAELLSTTGPN